MIRVCILAVLAAIFSVSAVCVAAQQSPESATASADSATVKNKVILIVPFQNASKAPGLEWIGEAFSEVLGQQIQSPSTFVISREDRLYAFDRVGIPATAQLSRATLLRIAQQMDVNYVVLGSYTYDGNIFSTKAQVLDMGRLHLLPSITESGSLLQVIDIQAATSWDLMRQIQPGLVATKQDFVAETKDIRLDALENYVRGIVASDSAEKVRRLKEAVRLNPNYSVAMLQLGRTYFEDRDYASAITWFSKVPVADKHAAEANFFLGLSAYYNGNLDRAADAFRFVATRLPLTEVYNNLGVVEARRGKSASLEYIREPYRPTPAIRITTSILLFPLPA